MIFAALHGKQWHQVSDSSVPATAFCPHPRQLMAPALSRVVRSAWAADTTVVHASLARLDEADGDLTHGSVGPMRALPAAAVFLPLPLHAAFDFLLGKLVLVGSNTNARRHRVKKHSLKP